MGSRVSPDSQVSSKGKAVNLDNRGNLDKPASKDKAAKAVRLATASLVRRAIPEAAQAIATVQSMAITTPATLAFPGEP